MGWIGAAVRCGDARALPVLLALKAKADAGREAWVKPPATSLQDLGVGRMARSRAIAALERAGLVEVRRRRGRPPLVRLVPWREGRAVASLAFLPRTFLARTAHGTAFFWDRELGLLARDERTGRWRGLGPDELRRGYPDAWWAWTRFAALLPPGGPRQMSRLVVAGMRPSPPPIRGSFPGKDVCGRRQCLASPVTGLLGFSHPGRGPPAPARRDGGAPMGIREEAPDRDGRAPAVAGYALSRLNPVRHGLTARSPLLPWEDAAELEALLDALVEEHRPAGPTERHLVGEVAAVIWRQRRVGQAEAAMVRDGLRGAARGLAGREDGGRGPRPRPARRRGRRRGGGAGDGGGQAEELADLDRDERLTRKALRILGRGGRDAYGRALAALREDTRAWWRDTLAGDDDDPRGPGRGRRGGGGGALARRGPEPARFLEAEVLPWYAGRRREIGRRPLIRGPGARDGGRPGRTSSAWGATRPTSTASCSACWPALPPAGGQEDRRGRRGVIRFAKRRRSGGRLGHLLKARNRTARGGASGSPARGMRARCADPAAGAS
jgi:DNA-binding transcriptional ArsR family regulator